MSVPILSRRNFLGASLSLVGWSFLPSFARAGARDPRLVVIILRGGLDGLAMVAPWGDPDYERARGGLILQERGSNAGIPLDGFFALNPSMPKLAALYRSREALIVHATATPYRGRSHIDGQDILESGLPGLGRPESGWLNRAMSFLPAGERVNSDGLAVGAEVPLIMHGPAPVLSLVPPGFSAAPDDTRERLLQLYRETSPLLEHRLDAALKLDRQLNGDLGRRALDSDAPLA